MTLRATLICQAALLVIAATFHTGCIMETDAPIGPPPGGEMDDVDSDDVEPEPETVPCDEGAERECKVSLPSTGSTNCYVGVEYCIEGSWTPCGDAIEGAR